MSSLLLTVKWDEIFGYDSNDTNYLNYMKTKDFVIMKKDNEYCTTKILINNYRDMFQNPDNYFVEDLIPKIIIGKIYFYKERMFCLESKAFLNFVKKVKNYYKKKLLHYRSVKNLEHRRLFGKYPRFL